MSVSRTANLEFGDEVGEVVRARMGYAFRVFCAVYGYQVIEGQSTGCRLFYGEAKAPPGFIAVPARYRLRPLSEPASRPCETTLGGEALPLFFGNAGDPDWLGEIFEWLSGADERSIQARDSVGRIPYAATVFGRYGISPYRAHAARLMAWLEGRIRGLDDSAPFAAPPAPFPGFRHMIVSTHDVDYYYGGVSDALVRVTKNIGRAVLLNRSPGFFLASVWQLLRILVGRRVGDFIPGLLVAAKSKDFRSSVFVICGNSHRRDANYALEQVRERLLELKAAGFELGLHGSYRSIIELGDLGAESARLNACTQEAPKGNRQHWLRFDRPERLFGCVERAGFEFDSTLGFSESAGFRNGACFAFPPYDFEREEPCGFLEIPLVLMDASLSLLGNGTSARQISDEVLGESRRFGWGGISILWHNPMEPLGVAQDINAVFWDLLDQRAVHQEKWTSGADFLASSLGRYQDAGLLRGLQPRPV